MVSTEPQPISALLDGVRVRLLHRQHLLLRIIGKIAAVLPQVATQRSITWSMSLNQFSGRRQTDEETTDTVHLSFR